jgi:streptogramin lyase
MMDAPTAAGRSRLLALLRALGVALLALVLVGIDAAGATADPAGAITEHPLPTAESAPQGITVGPDGNLWFTETQGNRIGRITTGGAITEFALPNVGSSPEGITAGPDGNLWFTEGPGNRIGRITTGGAITEFPMPHASSGPAGIAAGPDGNLWFTEFGGNRVGKITTAGVITEFGLPAAGSAPVAIVTGPDGNLWFTEFLGNRLARIAPDGGGLTEFTMPSADSRPNYIVVGPDSKIWFTEQTGDRVARIATDMTGLTEFPLPAGALPDGITVGCDGNFWIAEAFGDAIGRLAPDGATFTEFALPNAKSGPIEIVPGPDQNLWFTEDVADLLGINGNRIGKIGAGCGDVTPPTLTVPGAITVLATIPAGATVTYSVTATDADSPPATVTCAPPSGATFAIGTTTVHCKAVDSAQNAASGSFAVNVVGAPGQINLTVVTVISFPVPPLVERALITPLRAADDALARGRPGAGCASLTAFVDLSRAASGLGRPLTRAQGALLVADGQRIRAVIGC